MRRVLEEMAGHAGLRPKEMALVRRLPLFQHLREEELAGLLRSAMVRRFERNHLLFNQGDAADRFYVVLEGWVRLYRAMPDGGEVTINLFTEGESLAEAALLAGAHFPVNGITADDSRLLIVQAGGFLAHLERNPRLCLDMMASMARRLHGFVRQVEQLSHRSTAERLAAFLVRLAPSGDGPCSIRLPIDKNLIAARLGMQPETFSRALGKLRKQGVTAHGNQIDFEDINKLRQMLGDDDGQRA